MPRASIGLRLVVEVDLGGLHPEPDEQGGGHAERHRQHEQRAPPERAHEQPADERSQGRARGDQEVEHLEGRALLIAGRRLDERWSSSR